MPKIQPTPAEIQKYFAVLEETPPFIVSLISGLDETRLHWSPNKRDWSAVEILAHLRACESVWSFSIYAMLADNNPTLPLLDERKWAKVARYTDLDFHPSFQAFTLKRAELLLVLRNLPEASWSRSAVIEGRNHTVFSQVRRMALHEQEHLAQIEAVLKQDVSDE